MIRSAIYHWRPVAVVAIIGAAAILQTFGDSPAMTRHRQAQDVPSAGPVNPWPRPIPVRLKPDGRDELFVTTLGTVTTPLADGTFDPVEDQVTTDDGRVIPDYYKSELKIPFFQPIDKSNFPLPPSGWCSWYYYYQEINADEILANARWIAEHLKPYGARYVQIDDGWQGTGHGLGENRDWTTIDVRFREPGMAAITDSIRALGLEAGLWLAPHGQSNETVAHSSGAFLWKPDGSSASSTWEGTYLVDPSLPAAHTYLHDLFTRLRGWGYTYFKIDGQPIVIREFTGNLKYMAGPVPEDEPGAAAAELYRGTLRTIRDAIGDDSYLLGCWGIPLPGVGIMNGSRTAGDIVQGWQGFLVAAEAIQRWNFLHNIAWYSDPDVFLVRPPLTEGMARAWATIQGLSSQALMASDRMPDLPASRVEVLRRIYPAVDIRPLDLFNPDNVRKPIWDLKVSHLGRTYDVVAVFNYETERVESRLVSWDELGLDPNQLYHVYDFWQGTYLGAWSQGVFLSVPPADVRVVTLIPATQRPVLVSTSRHITQGWVDLLDLEAGGSATQPTLAGRSRIIAGDPYTLTVGLPRSAPTFQLAGVKVNGERREHPVRVSSASHQGYATVTLESDASQTVSWELEFEPAQPYLFPVISPSRLQVTQEGLSQATLHWPTQYHVKAGYLIEIDGEPLGVAFEPWAELRGLAPGRSYRIGVRSIWYDGTVGEQAAEVVFTPEVPEQAYLSDLEPIVAQQDWGSLNRDRSVDGNPLTVAGVTYEKGLGTHARSELRYELFGAFLRFQARVGIDDEVAPPTPVEVVFQVWGDGRLLWESDPIRNGDRAVAVDADVRGVQELVLRVLPGGDGINYDHADWLDALVTADPA
jgi:hypothetical protein